VISLLLEQLGPGYVLRRERNTEVGHAMHAWQKSSQDRGVRSVGDWTMREGLRETDAIGREPVKRGSFDLLVAIATNVVGAQGVDRDQEDVGRGLSRSRLPPGSRNQEKGAQRVCKSPHEVNLS